MKDTYSNYQKRHAQAQRTSMSRPRLSQPAFEAALKRYSEVIIGNHFNADYQDLVQLKKRLCLDVVPRP